jgi:hypothetical protein
MCDDVRAAAVSFTSAFSCHMPFRATWVQREGRGWMGVWRRNRNRGQGTRPWSCVGAVGHVGCCCWSFSRLWGYVCIYGLPGVQGKAPAAAAAAAGNAGPGVGSRQGWTGRCTPERLRIAIGFNLVLQQLQQKWQSARTSHMAGPAINPVQGFRT